MTAILNKFISLILVPIFFNTFLPFIHIASLFSLPQEVISLSENGIGSEEDPVFLTAHRGVQAEAPQNTIPAYEKAVEYGYYTAECDIQLTKDNEWVLNHNSDTGTMFCEVAEISECTLAELKTFSYKTGANFWKYEDLRIPTLGEYLDVFVGSETRPQIEIKSENFDMLYKIIDEVKARNMEDQAIIISFNYEQLKFIDEMNSGIELWYLCDEITPEIIAQAEALNSECWLSPSFSSNTAETIQLAIDAGVGCSFWTVNELEDAKMLYDMGIRYIETDIFIN